ncbi:MAG: hypothetical protein EOP61_04615 [Sphingomonadales bacterium]|nr:MAG: hypothetical protein EOP61_04615 [Sphingomonadales bacterium]
MVAIIDMVGKLRSSLRPSLMLRYFVAASILATLAVIWLALHSPAADVAFVRDASADVVEVRTPHERFVVSPDAQVRFEFAGGTALAIPAATLADFEQSGEADRLAVAAQLAAGDTAAQVYDPAGQLHRLSVSLRPGRLGDLNAEFWLPLACGLASLLFGLGVWAMRADNWAARCYALATLGLFVTFGADAMGAAWNIATDRQTVDAVMGVNIGAVHFFALAFLTLFARFPQPLLARPIVLGAVGLAGAVIAIVLMAAEAYYELSAGIMLAEFALLFAIVAAQTWRGRRDRASRASLAIMIAAIGLGIVLYVFVTILPALLGVPRFLTESAALPLFTLVSVGIGVAIVRASLFALDRLTRTIMISICLAAVVLLLDIALVGWLSQQSDVALGLAIAAVALVYLPARELVLRRSERRREEQARRSLHLATGLAFAPDHSIRAMRWRAAIQATFEPLEIADDPAPSPIARIGEQGLALHLPAIAGAPGLLCRHAGGGQRLFVPGDVEAARALITIVDRLVEARDAYTQGASEERRRIARDLHDDVSGRLMTSLHRSDAQEMRHDVREAMADIRVIMNGLIAEPRALGEIFADIRHEAQQRLNAANVALRWPLGPEFAAVMPVAYPVYRHIVSVVRESVSNIIRHADATTAEIGVGLEGTALTLSIVDNGRGIASVVEMGNGLGNCVRRAIDLGGDFEILPAEVGSAIRFRLDLGSASRG